MVGLHVLPRSRLLRVRSIPSLEGCDRAPSLVPTLGAVIGAGHPALYFPSFPAGACVPASCFLIADFTVLITRAFP